MTNQRVAAIQCNSTEDIQQNMTSVLRLCQQAVDQGATLLVLPEVFLFRKQRITSKQFSDSLMGASMAPLIEFVTNHQIWLVAGSVCESIDNSSKTFNTSIVINPKGECQALYRKIHLFDVELEKTSIKESKWFESGDQPVITSIDGISTGLSICYDLRFPELYRYYAQQGAELLTIPSSFTQVTGEAHWHVLVRARAIENQCVVIAPNQVGHGPRKVPTFGHSLIVDPWGQVLAEASGDLEEVIVADIDWEYGQKIREQMPIRQHTCSEIHF